MGAVRTSYPRFRRAGTAPRLELTDDDKAVLERVFRHRFIRAEDIYRLFPERTPDRLSRRLTQLYRAGFLDRPRSQIDYFRGEGSQSLVYGLDTEGARFLAEERGLSVGSGEWKARNRSYTRDNLDHTLAVSRFLIHLELECAGMPGLSYIPFEEIAAAAPTRQTPRADRWSVPLRAAGSTAAVQVVPDAIFGLRKTDSEGHAAKSYAFLEIDRGSMTIVPARTVREHEAFLYRSTILRKLLAYAESYRLELHMQHLGLSTPRVLFLAPSPARSEAMRQAAERFVLGPLKVPEGLFLFGDVSHGCAMLGSVWSDIGGNKVALAPRRSTAGM